MIIYITLIVSAVTAFQPQPLNRPRLSSYNTRRRKILQPPHYTDKRYYNNILVFTATNNDDVEYPRDLLQRYSLPLESSTDATSTFTPSEDTPLANAYYLKLQQTKKLKEKEVSENTEVESIEKTPTEVDVGITSEQNLPIKVEEVVTTNDSLTKTQSPEFTDLNIRQSRDVIVSIDEEKEDDSLSSSSLSSTNDNNVLDTDNDIKETTDDTSSGISSSIEEEEVSTSTTEDSVDTTEESVIDTSNKNPTTTSSQPSSSGQQLIQTQPASTFTFDKLTLPTNNLDVEAYGLLPLIIIGVSLSLVVGVYMNQSRDQNKGEESEDGDDTKNLLQKVKDAGTAGAISYALWEFTFWGVSFIIGLGSYYKLTGHWPDLTNADDVKKISLNAFLFVNVARFAVPLRIGLALATVPWVEENILRRFNTGEQEEEKLSESEQITMTSDLNSGIDPTLLQKKKKPNVPGENTGNIEDYCKPGKVDEECAESVKEYLDDIANTGKIATDDEARTIVNYLDSLSSNVTPPNGYSTTGSAFTNYLDALSEGSIPSPSSAKAVQTYLNDLTTDQDSRVEVVEDRLSKIEGSLNNMPEEIASRLDEWQALQDAKMKADMDKILSLLADNNKVDK